MSWQMPARRAQCRGHRCMSAVHSDSDVGAGGLLEKVCRTRGSQPRRDAERGEGCASRGSSWQGGPAAGRGLVCSRGSRKAQGQRAGEYGRRGGPVAGRDLSPEGPWATLAALARELRLCCLQRIAAGPEGK